MNRTKAKLRAGTAVVMLGAALTIAACGSSSSSTSSSAAPAASASSATVSRAAATGVSISTAKGPSGAYLTGASGRALYLWVADKNGMSACSGGCAQAWPPVISSAKPAASGGVKSGQLGTTTRSDGSKQVTYDGHPLYYFDDDTAKGMTTGQGSDEFGAKWWLVAPSGAAITGSGSTAAASTSSSSGY
jgi:predicted lipoprotein with Yx(FWY)xxD motif